jgi:hypothetical protein
MWTQTDLWRWQQEHDAQQREHASRLPHTQPFDASLLIDDLDGDMTYRTPSSEVDAQLAEHSCRWLRRTLRLP